MGIITRFLKNAATLQVFLWLQIVGSFSSNHMSVFDNELEGLVQSLVAQTAKSLLAV